MTQTVEDNLPQCDCEAPALNGHREECQVYKTLTELRRQGLPRHAYEEFVADHYEAVDHPAHYGGADDPYETIKVIESMGPEVADGFCRGNAIKYLMRAGKKDEALQDLRKAAWYANRLVEYHRRHAG